MATIINNPNPHEKVTNVESDSGGWAIAVVVLLLVVAGGIYYWLYQQSPETPSEPSTTINVTLPEDRQTIPAVPAEL